MVHGGQASMQVHEVSRRTPAHQGFSTPNYLFVILLL